MPSVKDVIVKKPSAEEQAAAKAWPIWQCEAKRFDWAYTQTETCLILEGDVEVSDQQSSVSFGPGDMVVFPVDLECVWNIKSPVRKHYSFS